MDKGEFHTLVNNGAVRAEGPDRGVGRETCFFETQRDCHGFRLVDMAAERRVTMKLHRPPACCPFIRDCEALERFIIAHEWGRKVVCVCVCVCASVTKTPKTDGK